MRTACFVNRRNKLKLGRNVMIVNSWTSRINGTGIFTYIYHKNQLNVGKYTSPIDPRALNRSCCHQETMRKNLAIRAIEVVDELKTTISLHLRVKGQKGLSFSVNKTQRCPTRNTKQTTRQPKKKMITWPEEPTLKGIGNNSYRLHNRRSEDQQKVVTKTI